MNYNDQILENKAFNFFKQLMYNFALSICIVLVGVLVMVYGFGFKLFEVLSDSQAPYFVTGDMVIVKAQNKYEIGDILAFRQGESNVTHRLLATYVQGGTTYYVCHGDNVQSINPDSEEYLVSWETDSKYINDLLQEHQTINNIPKSQRPINIQIVEEKNITGIVVNHISNLGTIVTFIKEHYLLVIAIVAGIWCVSNVSQNEIDMKKARRLI